MIDHLSHFAAFLQQTCHDLKRIIPIWETAVQSACDCKQLFHCHGYTHSLKMASRSQEQYFSARDWRNSGVAMPHESVSVYSLRKASKVSVPISSFRATKNNGPRP